MDYALRQSRHVRIVLAKTRRRMTERGMHTVGATKILRR